MLTTITITDLTRMSGDRVCIAGITSDGINIRPELDTGFITEEWLFDDFGTVIVRPFARVEMDLIEHRPEPPHSEDWLIDETYLLAKGTLTFQEKKNLLYKIADSDVASIFGAEIHTNPGYYVNEDEGNRSLGTIRVRRVFEVKYYQLQGNQRWEYRINFVDQAGDIYRLGVTDLAFRNFLDYLRVNEGMDAEKISQELTEHFQKNTLYLRIGLARPTWQKHPHCCFLQINGVYSFPDYLDGRCFADFD